MPNARNKNRARLQSFCAASDSKRTGRHSAFVSRNQTHALAFLALIGLHRRFPPMRYHSRDINRRRTTKSPHTAVSRPRSPLMVKSELLVPRYLANRSAYCRRPSPPLRSGFRVDILPLRLSAPRVPPARAGQSRPLSAPLVHVVSGFSPVPWDPVTHSARCRRPSPPLSSGFRIEILPYPLGPVLPYLASTTASATLFSRLPRGSRLNGA